MTAPIQKTVRVLSATGPTGAHGTLEKVRVFPNFTGPTGEHPVWGQINAAQQAVGPTGTIKSVVDMAAGFTGPTGTFKSVIIVGYTGPA